MHDTAALLSSQLTGSVITAIVNNGADGIEVTQVLNWLHQHRGLSDDKQVTFFVVRWNDDGKT